MKSKNQPVRVVNVNKNGEVFSPADVVVHRSSNPEIYKFLEGYLVKGGSYVRGNI